MSEALVDLIADSATNVVPAFRRRRFRGNALRDLADLEFVARAQRIGTALEQEFPSDARDAMECLLAMLGPELTQCEGNGLVPFYYFPHAHYLATAGVRDFEQGMRANYELTKRFTAEFSIRPLVVHFQSEALDMLFKWTADPNPHVRRMVSEGTRPRLPWAMRLVAIQKCPQLTLPLLENLKDDEESYVRRSVANHLGDLAKDHPELVFRICHTWLDELRVDDIEPRIVHNRHSLIRHAVRLPAQKGDARALEIRRLASLKSARRAK